MCSSAAVWRGGALIIQSSERVSVSAADVSETSNWLRSPCSASDWRQKLTSVSRRLPLEEFMSRIPSWVWKTEAWPEGAGGARRSMLRTTAVQPRGSSSPAALLWLVKRFHTWRRGGQDHSDRSPTRSERQLVSAVEMRTGDVHQLYGRTGDTRERLLSVAGARMAWKVLLTAGPASQTLGADVWMVTEVQVCVNLQPLPRSTVATLACNHLLPRTQKHHLFSSA